MKRKAIAVLIAVMTVMCLFGCSEAEMKSKEISRSADSFDVTRRITVINTRTDTILWQLTGQFSVQHSSGDLDIIVERADGEYAKHFFDLNEWTTYVVEDLVDEHLPDHYYEVKFLPKDGETK